MEAQATGFIRSGRHNILTIPKFDVSPFKLHDIGEGITEVEIIKWYVEEGQEVSEFDALCEVQSDKSVVELTSHANGTVKGIKKSAGEVVKVGQVLCEIHTTEENGEEGLSLDSEEATPIKEEINSKESEPQPEIKSTEVKNAEKITEDLEKSQHSHVRKGRHPLHVNEDLEHDEQQGVNQRYSDPIQLHGEASILPSPPQVKRGNFDGAVQARREDTESVSSQNGKSIIKASPAIRTLASKLNINLNEIRGTGENGRITKIDLQKYDKITSSSPNLNNNDSLLNKSRHQVPESTRIEFGRTRKIMYKALGEQGKIPHFGYSHSLDLTRLLPYIKASNPSSSVDKNNVKNGYLASDIPPELVRNPINQEEDKQKTTLLSFLVKGFVLALEEHPIMRAKVKEENDKKWLEIGRDAIIGVAVSDPKYGLLTPSLPPFTPTVSISEITSHLHSLRESPSKPSIPANITISSIGGLGEGLGAMPILPPGGGLAICAVGKAKWELELNLSKGDINNGKSIWELNENEVIKGGWKSKLKVNVGWSGDHRVLEGAELISFTETWKKYIEQPWLWINITS
ncbi:uncharacterized protein L201_005110 [Kwoniella dendrophila CBS 6074]|uniref:Dihydrolipoamide acetyltransferase component of pyruvate dehydrogenase complex n=1 Tax=Kwoniella dendrophila CBS 6074 TaxID=1295534 RepID=A0AAX4JZP3_9TREE